MREVLLHWLRALIGCALLALCLAASAAPWADCLRASTGMCFSNDHPGSNEKIGVLVVINNRGDDLFCIQYLGRTRMGNTIHFEAVYFDCGDSGPLQTEPEPVVIQLQLGPLAPGVYTIVFDAPAGFSSPEPPKGPIYFQETLVVGPAAPLNLTLLPAIEFYRPGANHYFVTTIPEEINLLDDGRLVGWTRTGESFDVVAPSAVTPYTTTPVCRLYGRPEAGLDSHFYSASPAECQQTLDRFPSAWILESSNVFKVLLPDFASGSCPIETVPVYRVFNGRSDANHRYTTFFSVRVEMIGKGWIAEGYGPDGVAMCVPGSP